MDEMKIKSSFLKAIISTTINHYLRKNGLEGLEIHIGNLEICRDNNEKHFVFNIELAGNCSDEMVRSLAAKISA